jgi:hypothetical protein
MLGLSLSFADPFALLDSSGCTIPPLIIREQMLDALTEISCRREKFAAGLAFPGRRAIFHLSSSRTLVFRRKIFPVDW